MRFGWGVGLAAATALVSAGASQAAPSPAGLTPETAQKLARVGGPKVSPDGAWVLYTVTTVDTAADKNTTQLWMVSWDGKVDLQLTYGKSSVSEVQWSPDGRYISFISDREGEAKGDQVWVLDRRGGEARQLTAVDQALSDYRWSPDGKRLLLQLTQKAEPDEDKGAKPKPPKPIVLDRYHFKQDIEGYLTDKQPHLYLFDVATKTVAKLTSNPVVGATAFGEDDGAWSPDGAAVAFVSNQAQPDPDRVADKDVFVVAATPGSTPRQLTRFTGEDVGPLVWTRDGKAILFREGVSPRYSIYDEPRLAMVPASGGDPVILAPTLDQWVGPPVLSPDGGAALSVVSDDRQDYVASTPLQPQGRATRITKASGAARDLDVAAGRTALIWSSDLADPEIYALEDGALRRLTGHNDALLTQTALVPAEDMSARAADGSEVHALLSLPLGYKAGAKAPLLLRIHGGPTSQDTHGFNVERQLFAARGYAVLNVNYRGSTGRGHAYSEAINADWGHKEVLDLLAAVDAAVATGKIDPNAMGVGGWSYGGILTDYVIASTTRFKAASSGAGTANLLGFYGVDEYILQYDNELGPPWKALAAYLKLSYPFLHADAIKTPTLFMGGDKDFNVPLQGGEQMYQALKSVGTPAELVVYPGAFHGFTRPSYIKDRYERWFAWYDKYVRGVVPPAPAPDGAKTPGS